MTLHSQPQSASAGGWLDQDWEIRLAAFRFIDTIRDESRRVFWRDLKRGFPFNGDTIHLVDPSGIFRPQQLRSPGAALSIRTSPPDSRYGAPYDDKIRPDTDFIEYRYRKGVRGRADNEALRRCGELRRPLLWLYGLSEGCYEAEYPAWVVGDDPSAETFQIAIEPEVISPARLFDGGLPELKKAYTTYEAKRRMHQTRFREMVLGAYAYKCTICRLGTSKSLVGLLDAAHIREDRDEQGHPIVSNGLSLCKIHHSAYDLNIIGIDRARYIHVRQDILDVQDGPMLRHGIQSTAGQQILVPRAERLQPDSDHLEYRFARFLAA